MVSREIHIIPQGVSVHPEKKTADVWDAVTETTVENTSDTDKELHLKTYILNEKGNTVGKTETDFIVGAGKKVLAMQSVLTYSPVLFANIYTMICELYENEQPADKQAVKFGFFN